MMYLIMPIVLLMVIKNDSDSTKKNTIAIYLAEDMAETFKDNKNLDYISSLEQQRSGAHRYVKIMTKRFVSYLCSI
jgi:hypothetical protein